MSWAGLTVPQWVGCGPIVASAGASGAAGGATAAGGVGHQVGAWLGEGCKWPERNMGTIATDMSWRTCASCALDATRLLIVTFFWINALARLSSDVVIWRTLCSSSAMSAPNADLLAVMQLMSRISTKAVVQWSFQLGQV